MRTGYLVSDDAQSFLTFKIKNDYDSEIFLRSYPDTLSNRNIKMASYYPSLGFTCTNTSTMMVKLCFIQEAAAD